MTLGFKNFILNIIKEVKNLNLRKMKLKSCFLIGSVWSHGVMQDFYDPSRIDSMQEMFKTTAEHPSVIPLNGTKPIPGTF